MPEMDTVVKYWVDQFGGELWYQTYKGYCGKWHNPGWNKFPLPPGCTEDTPSWDLEFAAKKKLNSLHQLLTEHREKQYYCRTPADETLWRETLETLFGEEQKDDR